METLIIVHNTEDAALLRQALQETDVTVLQMGTSITGVAYDVIVCPHPRLDINIRYVDEVLRPRINPGGRLILT